MISNSGGNEGRILTAVLVSTLLASAFLALWQGVLVSAQPFESITILSNGSIQPANVPIQRSGSTYVLTRDVETMIWVKASNLMLDGDNHTVHRTIKEGIFVDSASNVTIKNFKLINEGIILRESTQCKILDNYLSGDGIHVFRSSHNLFSGNYVSDNAGAGVYAETSSDNTWKKNFVDNNTDGFKLWYCSGSSIIGNGIYNNSYGVQFGSNCNYNLVRGNRIVSSSNEGVSIVESSHNEVAGNQVMDNFWGLNIVSSEDNRVWGNNFVDNDVQAVSGDSVGNFWDEAEVGNFWSDYDGVDVDDDGIGDSPYFIDGVNQDNFPLMAPVDVPKVSVELPELPAAPSVVLLNPENATYADASVPVDFVVDKQAAWMGYSLDGQHNVTVTENVTLTGLSDGVHTLMIYANDIYGFTGASETVTFTIATFPTTSVVAIIITTAVVAVGLLFYFKKRKN